MNVEMFVETFESLPRDSGGHLSETTTKWFLELCEEHNLEKLDGWKIILDDGEVLVTNTSIQIWLKK